MNFKNKTNQKIISALLIILILMPTVILSVPRKASAQIATVESGPHNLFISLATKVFAGMTAGTSAVTATQQTVDTSLHIKDFAKELLREVLRTFARRLLQQMTQATVNWINSGFHGQPLYLESPGSFFKDIAKTQIKDMVSLIGYDNSSYPFGKSFALNIINGYKSTFAQNAQYSLSKVINDPQLLNNYRNNFSTGGWDGFMLNTQYPQNNYLGSQIMYSNYLAQQIQGTEQAPAQTVQALLQQGQGFLSPQMCATNPSYNNFRNEFQKPTFKCPIPEPNWAQCPIDPATGDEIGDCSGSNSIARTQWKIECNAKKAEWDKTNSCPEQSPGVSGLINSTPGSVVANQIFSAVSSPTRQTELSAAMGNSLSAIFDALLNKLMSSGLNALSNKISGTGNKNNDDNFDYFGNTLGAPGTTTTGGGFDWNSPDQIIVLSTFKSNVQSTIDRGNEELKIFDNDDPNAPGLLQIYAKIWPKESELAACMAGPSEDQSAKDARLAQEKVLQEQQLNELTTRKSAILETLAALTSVRTELSTMSTEPARGSAAESLEINLKQKFDGMIVNISTIATINDAKSKLDAAKAKLAQLDKDIEKCQYDAGHPQ